MKIIIESFTSNSKEFFGHLVITCDCHNIFSVFYEKNREYDTETNIFCPYCQKKILFNSH